MFAKRLLETGENDYGADIYAFGDKWFSDEELRYHGKYIKINKLLEGLTSATEKKHVLLWIITRRLVLPDKFFTNVKNAQMYLSDVGSILGYGARNPEIRTFGMSDKQAEWAALNLCYAQIGGGYIDPDDFMGITQLYGAKDYADFDLKKCRNMHQGREEFIKKITDKGTAVFKVQNRSKKTLKHFGGLLGMSVCILGSPREWGDEWMDAALEFDLTRAMPGRLYHSGLGPLRIPGIHYHLSIYLASAEIDKEIQLPVIMFVTKYGVATDVGKIIMSFCPKFMRVEFQRWKRLYDKVESRFVALGLH